MKFSFVSLIAAALAGTAGSAIAAPCPLHARALEAVINERDLNVYSGLALLEREIGDEFVDGLFTRTSAQEGAHLSAEANYQAALAHETAEKNNDHAYEVTNDGKFYAAAYKHRKEVKSHVDKGDDHAKDRDAIAKNKATKAQIARSHRHVRNVENAEASEKSAEASSRKALAAIEKHKATQVHEAAQILHEAAQVHEAAQILHEATKHEAAKHEAAKHEAAKHEAAQVLHNMKAG